MTKHATKILHISDLHFSCQSGGDEADHEIVMRHNAEILRSEEADLILVTGDLTNHGTTDSDELQIAKQWLDTLQCPVLVLPGNHDLGANQARAKLDPTSEQYEDVAYSDTRYARTFGGDTVLVSWLGGVRVVAIALRDREANETLVGLEKVLETSFPTIVIGHYPVVRVRDSGPIPKVQPLYEWLGEDLTRLKRILLKSESVIAYCCGHVHASTAKVIGGTLVQISAGALGAGPSAYRVYTIIGNEFLVETRLGIGPLWFWETYGEIGSSTADYHLGSDLERRLLLKIRQD